MTKEEMDFSDALTLIRFVVETGSLPKEEQEEFLEELRKRLEEDAK